MARVALAEMIEELRTELEEAAAKGKGRDLRFELGEVTLEAQVEVERKAEGKVEVQYRGVSSH